MMIRPWDQNNVMTYPLIKSHWDFTPFLSLLGSFSSLEEEGQMMSYAVQIVKATEACIGLWDSGKILFRLLSGQRSEQSIKNVFQFCYILVSKSWTQNADYDNRYSVKNGGL